ncbi:golgin subfamily A member 4 isoform X2 [Cephus cinctus]|uniref:Golgin subfamily A member 4 isoform X2 n=1 Tax=Cephus cinctus TaxID=211228 RepID=A0AAJ7BYH7_CEPCN|nr:golgin subfamily A member 4 isoform X2 [Cephus cinctus]
MFKKLKNKLAEEVKQSPSRLQASMQQLAQAVVSPAPSNSSVQDLSTSNDNFSLTDEATPKNSPARHGFQNVDLTSSTSISMGLSRRSSISSIASDASSLFPMYESPGSMFHLQSDMEQSASEADENISPQLDNVTKDQVYSAYRKMQSKYHKYRGRYSDLANHYQEMERVKAKLESVLVETQDKAVRKIRELKEQCELEQKAKAHLEEALRYDIEEKDHIISTLNTKVRLLQSNGTSVENLTAPEAGDQNQMQKQNQNPELLIDLSNEQSITSNNSSALEIENGELKEKVKKLETLVMKCKESLKRSKEKIAEVTQERDILDRDLEILKNSNTERFKSLEGDLNAARDEILKLRDQIVILKTREEESAISLAENKLTIHRELEIREEQIKQLRMDLKQTTELKDNLNETMERYRIELERLKLIHDNHNFDAEKNDLIQNLSKGKSEALKLMQEEMQQKVIDLEKTMGNNCNEQIEINKKLSEKIENLEKELEAARTAQVQEDVNQLKTLKQSLEAKEAQLEQLQEKFSEVETRFQEEKSERAKIQVEFSDLNSRYEELKAEKIVQKDKFKEETEVAKNNLLTEIEKLNKTIAERDQTCQQLNIRIQEYTSSLEKAMQKLKAQDAEIKSLKNQPRDDAEIEKLRDDLENKEVELLGLTSELKSSKMMINDLKEKLKSEGSRIDLINKEKVCLISNILEYHKVIRSLKQDCATLKSNLTECSVQQRNEISVLNQSLCEAMVTERNNFERSTNEFFKDRLSVLKEKNSKLNKELADLQSKHQELISVESERLALSTQLKTMNSKVASLATLEKDNAHLRHQLEQLSDKVKQLDDLSAKCKELEGELKKSTQLKSNLEKELKERLLEITEMKIKVDTFEEMQARTNKLVAELDNLQFKQFDIEEMRRDKESTLAQLKSVKKDLHSMNRTAQENHHLQQELQELKNKNQYLETLKVELEEMRKKNDEAKGIIESLNFNFQDHDILLKEKENLKSTLATLTSEIGRKDKEIEIRNEELDEFRKFIDQLTKKMNKMEADYLKRDEEQIHLLNELRQQNQYLQDNLNSQNDMMKKLKYLEEQQIRTIEESNKELEEVKSRNLEILGQLEMSENCRNETLKLKLDEIVALTEKNTELSKEVDELRTKSAEVETMKSKHVECLNELEQLRLKNEELLAENKELKDSKNELVKSIEMLQSTEKILNEKIMDLENKVAHHLNEITNLHEEIELRSSNFESVNKTKIDLESQLEAMKTRLLSLEIAEVENNKFKLELSRLTDVDTKNTLLSSKISGLEAENMNLLSEVERLKVLMEEKAAELKLLDARNGELLREIEKSNTSTSETIEDRCIEIQELKNKLKILEEQLEMTQTVMKNVENENSKMREELLTVKQQEFSEEILADNKKLKEEKKQLEVQLDEALITFQAKEIQMEIVNSELKARTDKLEEELKVSEEEQSMRLKQLVKEFQTQLHEKDEQIQAAMEKRFDRQQNYESDLIQQYKEQLKDFQVELTAKSEQIEDLILQNKSSIAEKQNDMDSLSDTLAKINKEHSEEVREVEKKWKTILQQKLEQLEIKHAEELNALTHEWRNERRPSPTSSSSSQTDIKSAASVEELESTSRVAMAAVQSNTGSLHTLQQTLVSQRRELAELRKIVKLRHDALEDSTEIEYLRNILFEYMMGRETMVLAKVIAAVVKFDQEQTIKILKKEEDKLTLLGSLGLS